MFIRGYIGVKEAGSREVKNAQFGNQNWKVLNLHLSLVSYKLTQCEQMKSLLFSRNEAGLKKWCLTNTNKKRQIMV